MNKKIKRCTLFLIVLSIWVVFINGIFAVVRQDDYLMPHVQCLGKKPASDENNEQVKDFSPPQGTFFVKESLCTSITLQNPSSNKMDVWISISYIGPTHEKYELPNERITLLPYQTSHHEISWVVPKDIVSGRYKIYLEVWDKSPQQPDAHSLEKKEALESLMIYHHLDEFDSFNTNMWRKTNHILERTSLCSNNVSVSDGKLRIHMPANVFEGGEFQSKEPLGFGAYEIRMKLPVVPSSITGFFLYHSPVMYHEIDIELYNQKNGDFFLTTYASGEKKNLHSDKTPFDLTAQFHNYRIEYAPDRVAFYIDDIFIKAWESGFTKEQMYLVVNSWYPHWLEGIAAKENNSYLEIDWIRY
jgi:hypothetical protein